MAGPLRPQRRPRRGERGAAIKREQGRTGPGTRKDPDSCELFGMSLGFPITSDRSYAWKALCPPNGGPHWPRLQDKCAVPFGGCANPTRRPTRQTASSRHDRSERWHYGPNLQQKTVAKNGDAPQLRTADPRDPRGTGCAFLLTRREPRCPSALVRGRASAYLVDEVRTRRPLTGRSAQADLYPGGACERIAGRR
jgi:hypothetical protein